MKEIIGIDIGGTNFRIGTVSHLGILNNFIIKSSKMLNESEGVKYLIKEIETYIEKYNLQDKISCVSIGIPSIVNKDKTFVYSTPNLKGIENINLAEEVSKEIKIPVFVNRDVNNLLLNDIEHLKIKDVEEKTIAGFYIGTGLGNAIFINGREYSGKNGVAGELGHIPLYGVNDKCTCGNTGCAEVRISGKYLQEIAKKYFPDTKIDDVFKYHVNENIIKEFVENLSIPIATEINILDPHYVILAGGVINMDSFPKEELILKIKEKTRKPYPESNLEILFTKHTQESGVLGSAKYAFSKMG